VIDLLDNFEEFRTLSTAEWNLRDILRSHVLDLIQNQRIYWKQRGKIKWVKLGNENTKFFHTKDTINFRHNHIATLQNEDQVEISDHDGKAAILWKSFKERMGNAKNPNMLFNIEDLYPSKLSSETKDKLEEAFSDKEIDDVIKDLPNDKYPGCNIPDFRFWNLIMSFICICTSAYFSKLKRFLFWTKTGFYVELHFQA
jgi:hypothetical protein